MSELGFNIEELIAEISARPRGKRALLLEETSSDWIVKRGCHYGPWIPKLSAVRDDEEGYVAFYCLRCKKVHFAGW